MKAFCYILALALPLLNGCTVLGPWPYDEHSRPGLGQATASQSAVHKIEEPLANVCQLKTTRKNIRKLWIGKVKSDGSAVLIDGRYLVTAAHNVYDYPLNNKLVEMKVSCNSIVVGHQGTPQILDRQDIIDRISVPNYAWRVNSNSKKYEYDYAFVDLGNYLNIASEFNISANVVLQKGDTIYIGGFPGKGISDAKTLFRGTGKVVDVTTNLITYDIITAGGNSGGPIWIQTDSGPVLVAIHIANRTGRLINESFINDWTAWRSHYD